jgi:hypothetical protein
MDYGSPDNGERSAIGLEYVDLPDRSYVIPNTGPPSGGITLTFVSCEQVTTPPIILLFGSRFIDDVRVKKINELEFVCPPQGCDPQTVQVRLLHNLYSNDPSRIAQFTYGRHIDT